MDNKIMITHAIIQRLEAMGNNEELIATYKAYLDELTSRDPLGIEELSDEAKDHYLRSIGVR